jgi:hypothetical protein
MRRGACGHLGRGAWRTSRVWAARRVGSAALFGLASITALMCGCGSQPPPATFHPAGSAATGPQDTSVATSAPRQHGGPLAWPPFGRNVHILMPGWLPPDHSQVPAVIAAKDFLLAFLYAEYTSNRDHRWMGYTKGDVVSALRANLAEPSVTKESFRGTIRFSQFRAFADPATQGALDVSECFDNAHSVNTSITTGKPVNDNTPPDQHYYRNTDVLAKARNGHWRVVQVYPVVYYPQAKECKG